jgi:hypothetical protein
MKRAAFVATFLVLTLSSTTAFAATSLNQDLLSAKQLPHWSTYYLGAAETTGCPESTFQKPTSHSTVREVFVQPSSSTLLLERLTVSPDPAATFDALLSAMSRCTTSAARLDGHVTFPRVRPVHLGTFAVPVKGYTLTAVVDSATVSGVVAYARKGHYVVALAELSLDPLRGRSFDSLLTKALLRIP